MQGKRVSTRLLNNFTGDNMKQYIDNIFTVSYLVFGLFLILVGVKDSSIYLFEAIGLIVIGGGLTVCGVNSLIDDMGV